MKNQLRSEKSFNDVIAGLLSCGFSHEEIKAAILYECDFPTTDEESDENFTKLINLKHDGLADKIEFSRTSLYLTKIIRKHIKDINNGNTKEL